MRKNSRKLLNIVRSRRKNSGRKRLKIASNSSIPRLSVFRSNKHLFVQIIDDVNHKTLVSVSDKEIKSKIKSSIEIAQKVGELLASKAQEKKIQSVFFDRGGYKYHGQVKALADGARAGGLKF